jgi:hypothetical protein
VLKRRRTGCLGPPISARAPRIDAGRWR